MADEFYPDLSGNGKGVVDLEQHQQVNYTTTFVVEGAIPLASDIAALRNSPPTGVVYLYEDERDGFFKWRAGDYSSLVALDTYNGIYIAGNSDLTGATGCWVRDAQHVDARHFGISAANNATNHLRIRSMFAVAPVGSEIIFPKGTIAATVTGAANNMLVAKSLTLRGHGPGKTILDLSGMGEVAHAFAVWTSYFCVKDMTIIGFDGTLGNNPYWSFIIGTRYTSGATSGAETDDIIFENVEFRGGHASIGVYPAGWDTPTENWWYFPQRIRIERCHFNMVGYQCIAPFGFDVDIWHNTFRIDPDYPYASFSCAIRAMHCKNVSIENNRFYGRDGTPHVIIMTGEMDTSGMQAGGSAMDAVNVVVNNNTMHDTASPILIYGQAGYTSISNNVVEYDLSSTGLLTTFVSLGATAATMRQGTLKVADNLVRGFNRLLYAQEVSIKELDISRNKMIGNSATGSPHDVNQIHVLRTGPADASIQLYNIVDNDLCVDPSFCGYPIYIQGAQGSAEFFISRNRLPEEVSHGAGIECFLILDAVGATLVKSQTGPELIIATDSQTAGDADATKMQGDNRRHPIGRFAKVIADLVDNPRGAYVANTVMS